MQRICLLAMLLLATLSGFSQDGKPPLSPRAHLKTDFFDLSYGQPSVRGREIFGHLVPYNQVWRTGANEATEITFKKAVEIAGSSIPAGTYTLFTIPAMTNKWTLILNKKLGQWGAFEYDKVKDQNVLIAQVKGWMIDKPVEQLTFEYAKDQLVMTWEKTKVTMPLKAK